MYSLSLWTPQVGEVKVKSLLSSKLWPSARTNTHEQLLSPPGDKTCMLWLLTKGEWKQPKVIVGDRLWRPMWGHIDEIEEIEQSGAFLKELQRLGRWTDVTNLVPVNSRAFPCFPYSRTLNSPTHFPWVQEYSGALPCFPWVLGWATSLGCGKKLHWIELLQTAPDPSGECRSDIFVSCSVKKTLSILQCDRHWFLWMVYFTNRWNSSTPFKGLELSKVKLILLVWL